MVSQRDCLLFLVGNRVSSSLLLLCGILYAALRGGKWIGVDGQDLDNTNNNKALYGEAHEEVDFR